MTTRPPLVKTIRTDADLFALWRLLLGPGGFGRRSLWLTFFDGDGRSLPLIVPIDDVPDEPHSLLVGSLGLRVAELVSDGAAASVAMALSRPGPVAMSAQDRRWARALRDALPREIARWPMHLATTERIQVFAPDDLLAAS